MKTILVLNFGSSSIKIAVFRSGKRILQGLVQHTNAPEKQCMDLEFGTNKIHESLAGLPLTSVVEKLLDALAAFDIHPDAVGHRVLHGGESFTASTLVTEEVKDAIRANIPLGPLHNPANLQGIEACEKVMPGVPNVAVFDTAFHQTMPPKAYMYGLPYEYYERLHVRRYGFHGTSHRYVSKRACEFLSMDPNNTRVITCHLGNGSSMAAVMNGKCVDTSMGLTPLEGVVMGTRSGSLDPAVVQFIANNENMTVDEVLDMCNKESGLLGISGVSSDMCDINAAADAGNERAALVRDMLHYGIKKYIGSYAAAMGGVDVIVFTAGIGENDAKLRESVMKDFEFMDAKLDPVKNVEGNHKECIISTDDSKVKIVIIPTDEAFLISQDVIKILGEN